MMTEIEKYIVEIFSLIYSKNQLDQVLFDLSILNDKLGYSAIGASGDEKQRRRKDVINNEIQNIESEILYDYFYDLIKKGDCWLFEPSHFEIFVEEMTKRAKKIIFFNLTSAIELQEDDLIDLTDMLSHKLEKKVVIDHEVDQSILGGAIIKKDNHILDFSLKTKLNTFAEKWKQSILKSEPK